MPEPQLTRDGVTFECVGAGMPESRPDHFFIRKSEWMAARYEEFAAEFPSGRVVELGIDQGASTAFLSLLWDDGRLIAFDLADSPAPALTQFLDQHDAAGRVRTCWGVDQSDRSTVLAEVDDFMGPGPLDLVIDDASHLFGPSVASFETLFPRLRPGGCYVIEDWAWELQLEQGLIAGAAAGTPEVTAALKSAPAPRGPFMASLVPALTVLAGSRPDIVADLKVRGAWAELRRGPAPLGRDWSVGAAVGGTARSAVPDLVPPRRRRWRP